jgi:hypothetical protein
VDDGVQFGLVLNGEQVLSHLSSLTLIYCLATSLYRSIHSDNDGCKSSLVGEDENLVDAFVLSSLIAALRLAVRLFWCGWDNYPTVDTQ